MTTTAVREYAVNPALDLVLERVVDVSPDLVWKAWTTPEHVKKWFTPAPWQTVECDIDLRPGGVFRTVMRSPDGQDVSFAGCYLEIIDRQRIVWTFALAPGFRPQPAGDSWSQFTAVVTITPEAGGKTRYHAHVMHRDEASRTLHDERGFRGGWNTALDQLVALARTLK